MSDKMKLSGAVMCAVFAGLGYFVGGLIGALLGVMIALYRLDD